MLQICIRSTTSWPAIGVAGAPIAVISKQCNEVDMAIKQDGRIVETPTEARAAESGPSVLALLAISTGLAIILMGGVWFLFFRT